jgi:predicted aldo/keto reductase-like oxidoreductase
VLTKIFGATGERLGAIGFGGMRFSDPRDPARCADLLRYAHTRGIDYFDTAPFYCEDQSEAIFGLALSGLPRESFRVSTKSSAADGVRLRADLERSLERLRLDRIDFFHIWCLMSRQDWDSRLAGGALDAAQRAQQDGLVRHLVCSSHLPGAEIADVLACGAFAGVTLGYNAVNFPYRAPAVRAAAELGLGVVAMNPLAGGLIPRNPGRFAFLAEPGEGSVVAGALRFLLADPSVTVALVGFATEREVDEAVAAAADVRDVSPGRAAALRAQVEERFDQICTGCGYCLPCPVGIPIPRLLDVYNVRLLGGDDGEVQARYRWHWNISEDLVGACTDCGDCEPRCTQHLPIRERMRSLPAPRRER